MDIECLIGGKYMNNYAEIYNFDNYSGKNEMLKNKDIAIVQKINLFPVKMHLICFGKRIQIFSMLWTMMNDL